MSCDKHQFYDHINVLIKPTDGCNLRCKYCFHQDYGYDPRKLDLGTLRHFFDITFSHYNSVSIVWHGGEPTFVGAPYFQKCVELAVELADQYGVSLQQAMQTNGTLLNEHFIDIIKRYEIGVGISYDGPINTYTRNSTDAFMKTHKLLRDNGIQYGVISVVSGANINLLDDLYAEMQGLDISVQINPYINTSPSAPSDLIMSADSYIQKMKEFFFRWIEDASCHISVDPFIRMIRDIHYGKSQICARSSCMRNWLCLNADGTLTPCDRDFPKEYCYGHVSDYDDIRSIYDTEGYLKLMEHTLIRREKCRSSCDVYDLCEGGCNNDALFQGGLENNGGFSCVVNSALLRVLKNWHQQAKSSSVLNPVVRRLLTEFSCETNTVGDDGTINEGGKTGFASRIVDCRDNDFWNNIEAGVLNTVRALVDSGYFTISSCQGHLEGNPNRCVSVIGEKHVIAGFQKAIDTINSINPNITPITYHLLEVQDTCSVYRNEFKSPLIIDIIFGDYRENDTALMQNLFEQCVLKGQIICETHTDVNLKSPYIRQTSHIDVFY